jgi:L-lactate dehydrogenase complex protein LldE
MGAKEPLIVDIFIPCFVDQLAPQIGINMVKVLEKVGCTVNYNPNQTCCGQPAFNAGYFDNAREVAKKFLKDFPGADRYIVMPSASCAGMVRNSYEVLFGKDPVLAAEYERVSKNTFELTEFLVDVLGVTKIEGARLDGTATYHDSCSALRECHISRAPRQLLHYVSGLEIRELDENETCCGFGGTFAVKFESISAAMGEQKVQRALETKANYLISTDYSCLLHLDAYIRKNNLPLKTMHVADVLASGW